MKVHSSTIDNNKIERKERNDVFSVNTSYKKYMLLSYFYHITSPDWGEEEDNLFSLISSERKYKIKKYHYAIDRKLSLYAELLARISLSNISGLPISSIHFTYSPNGKPFWKGYPYYFNFSHTRNSILCCASSLGDVGADVEKINTPPFEVMNMIFHPFEREYMQNSSSLEKNYNFYKIWTRKEAYAKYKGTGITEDLAKINVLNSVALPYFYTWTYGEYLCSIYTEYPERPQIINLSGNYIMDYLKNSD